MFFAVSEVIPDWVKQGHIDTSKTLLLVIISLIQATCYSLFSPCFDVINSTFVQPPSYYFYLFFFLVRGYLQDETLHANGVTDKDFAFVSQPVHFMLHPLLLLFTP